MLKMGYQSRQLSIANSLPRTESVRLLSKGVMRFNVSLLIETTLVTIAAILVIRLFAASFISRTAWLVSPGILVAVALIPTAIRRYEFPKIDLNIRQIVFAVLVVCRTCIVVFFSFICGFAAAEIFRFWIAIAACAAE
jgi:hypothetical protein